MQEPFCNWVFSVKSLTLKNYLTNTIDTRYVSTSGMFEQHWGLKAIRRTFFIEKESAARLGGLSVIYEFYKVRASENPPAR